MFDILSILTLATGIATLSNVVLVAKRYREIKEESKNITEMQKKIHKASDMLKDANKILYEAKVQNNGTYPWDSVQKEEIIKLIEKIDDQVKKTDV